MPASNKSKQSAAKKGQAVVNPYESKFQMKVKGSPFKSGQGYSYSNKVFVSSKSICTASIVTT